jgi:hypothetical protein
LMTLDVIEQKGNRNDPNLIGKSVESEQGKEGIYRMC